MYLWQLANKVGYQCRDVRKTGRFAHVSTIFGYDVRRKRFITHGASNVTDKLNKKRCSQ